MKQSEIAFGALRLPLDYAAAVAALALAYRIRPFTDLIPGRQFVFLPEQLPPFSEYLLFSLVAAVGLIVLFAINRLYSLKKSSGLIRESTKIGFLVSVWMLFIIAYYFLVVHQLFFSRITLAHIWLFTILLVSGERILLRGLRALLWRFGIGRRRILFVGVSDLADRLFTEFSKDPRYRVIGALSPRRESRPQGTLKIIGEYAQLEDFCRKYGVEEIIQASADAETEALGLLEFCRSRQVEYHFIPDLLRLQQSNVSVEMIESMPLITFNQTALQGWGRVYKLFFDLSSSALLIVALTPVWLLVPLLIRLDSAGPVIYKSRRKFRDRTFNMYKFRTMVADADRRKEYLITQNERQGPLFKIKNDPRVTRLGRFLRKTSIDELPQLFNVLLGHMSLVGPRPHLPEEVEKYAAHHRRVFAIKPGVTGLAQTSGRSNLDFEEEVKLDVYYIENWSPILDLKLLLKSAGIVWRADGH